MGNNLPTRNRPTTNTTIVEGGQPVVVQQPPAGQSRTSFFGGSSKPKAGYTENVNQHLVLRGPAQFALTNLNTVFGEPIADRYPRGDGQVYHIKEYQSTYQGPFSKGIPNGKGVAHFKDGGYYSGDFVDGDAHGDGLYIYPNGSVYRGQFVKSHFEGPGTLIYSDGRMKYTGNFKQGLPDGLGR